jgi:hypothetical protein
MPTAPAREQHTGTPLERVRPAADPELHAFGRPGLSFSTVPSGTTHGASFLPLNHVLDSFKDDLPNLPFQVFLGRL